MKPFILNSEPLPNATRVVVETTEGEHIFSLEDLETLLLKFSHKGKPLRADGPVHVLKKDGSNINTPVKFVTAFRVE